MELVEIVQGALYAILWDHKGNHCLDEMADKLTDVEWLFEFFVKNKEKLAFYGSTIKTAVQKTRIEANELLQELLDLASSDQRHSRSLDDLFEPLHKEEAYNHPRFYTDFKAKGYKAPWVRIYAIRCDKNLYVITGYGIKLVRKMQEDMNLQNELYKLEKGTRYLREIGIL